MKFKFLFFLFALTLTGLSAFSQDDATRDSLYKLLKTKQNDTTLINIYNELCWPVYSFSDIDSAIKYGEKAIALCKQTGNEKKLSIALRRTGIAYINHAKYDKALFYEKQSLAVAKKINFKRGIASALNNLGVIYLDVSDFRKAIDYNVQTQKLYEELKDSVNLIQNYHNTGLIYKITGDLPKALVYLKRSLQITHKKNNLSSKGFGLNTLGGVYLKMQKFDSALICFGKAMQIFEQENNVYGIVNTYIEYGSLYSNQLDNKLALSYYFKAIKLNKENKEIVSDGLLQGNIAFAYLKLKRADSAIYYGEKSLLVSKETKDIGMIAFITKVLADAYLLKKNFAMAHFYLDKHIDARDSVMNLEREKEISQKQMRFEFDKKILADSLQFAEQQKTNLHKIELGDAKLKQEKFFRYTLIGGIILVIGFLIFLYNRFNVIKHKNKIIELQNQKVTQQKNIIEQKNKEVTDSINYAKRIQQAVLTGEGVWTKISKEYFILFKPKDIVSGDFFWAHTTPNGRCIWALADCTGHGVPGGFMSMLGNSFLNEIVVENRIYNPAEILNRLRDKIIQALEQKGVGRQQDGMDIALCTWNKVDNTLEYAGANNPAWLVRNKLMTEIKPDKMPIGLYAGEQKSFTTKKVQLQKNDIIYLCSDGYPDQFGGPKGKKFKYKHLQEHLIALCEEPMAKQKQLLEENFYDWKGGLEQVDDVCLVGIRV